MCTANKRIEFLSLVNLGNNNQHEKFNVDNAKHIIGEKIEMILQISD